MHSHQPVLDNDKLRMKLQTALKYARVTCALGAYNKYDDYLRTNGWATLQRSLTFNCGGYVKQGNLPKPGLISTIKKSSNSKFVEIDLNPAVTFDSNKFMKPSPPDNHWFYRTDSNDGTSWEWVIPLFEVAQNVKSPNNPKYNLSDEQCNLIWQAGRSRITRHGTCINYASLIFTYLWQHSDGIHRIELMQEPGFDHVFVVINRSGSADDPKTWGDAWVIDGWYKDGIIYHASEYKDKIKEIMQVSTDDLIKLVSSIEGSSTRKPNDEDKNPVVAEVIPKVNRYPTDDPLKSFYEYCEITDGRFAPLGLTTFKKIKDEETKHRDKMKSALADVRLFKNHENTIKPTNIPSAKKGYFKIAKR